MPSLPERPLSLDRRFVALRVLAATLPAAALAALGLAALSLTLDDAARLDEQDQIAAHGVRAEHPHVDIERDVSFFVFRARRYDVRFEDASGATHAQRVREHDVSVAPLVVEGPPEVHYDPSDPSRIAIGFARQNVGAQHAAIALLGVTGALFLGLAALALAFFSRGLRRARAGGLTGRAGVGEVLSLERSFDSRGELTGELHLTLAPMHASLEAHDSYRERAGRGAHLEGSRTERSTAITPAGDEPVFLDAACTRVLVVMTRDAQPVLVRRSGHPYRLTPAEQSELTSGAHLPPAASGTRDAALVGPTP
jgi:hypothetical protein